MDSKLQSLMLFLSYQQANLYYLSTEVKRKILLAMMLLPTFHRRDAPYTIHQEPMQTLYLNIHWTEFLVYSSTASLTRSVLDLRAF